MTFLVIWIVGAAVAYWLAERNLGTNMHPKRRREALCAIVTLSVVAWPIALIVFVLDRFGMIDDDGGDDA